MLAGSWGGTALSAQPGPPWEDAAGEAYLEAGSTGLLHGRAQTLTQAITEEMQSHVLKPVLSTGTKLVSRPGCERAVKRPPGLLLPWLVIKRVRQREGPQGNSLR